MYSRCRSDSCAVGWPPRSALTLNPIEGFETTSKAMVSGRKKRNAVLNKAQVKENPKFEAQNSKQIRMAKILNIDLNEEAGDNVFNGMAFWVIRISDLFRISGFEFRISNIAIPLAMRPSFLFRIKRRNHLSQRRFP
jgi:hypothetical protein